MKKNNISSPFLQKLKRREKTILYELLPPPNSLSKVDLHKSFSLFAETINKFSVDGVNIPEVREEIRNGARKSAELEKLEPIIVSLYLQRYGIENIIINRPIVYDHWDKQKVWLKNAYDNGVKNFIFVGGESSSITYPGLSVIEATKKVRTELKLEFPQLVAGGITIPTRTNEAKRIFNKTLAGSEFFTTQILYESESIKSLLRAYDELCKLKEIEPKTIFLSFAPIASYTDAELLTWLGVEIPQPILKELKVGWLGMAERSFRICEHIISDILEFVERENIQVPLGLNVEHISRRNFELSFVLLERISQVYLQDYKLTPLSAQHDTN